MTTGPEHPLVDVDALATALAGWVAAGHPVSTEPATPPPGNVAVHPGGLPVLDAAGAARVAAEGVLLDVRAPERYRGAQEPVDPVAGHIPGAVNLPVAGLLSDADADAGGWPDPARLRERFGQAGVDPARPVGAYCGSGVNAAHAVLALHVAAGRTDAALYVGSWSHWVTDLDRPVATGAEP